MSYRLISRTCLTHKRVTIRRMSFFDGLNMQASASRFWFYSGLCLLRRKCAVKTGQAFVIFFDVLGRMGR